MVKDTIRNLYIAHESIAAFVNSNANIIMGKPGLAITYNYRILTDALAEYIKQRNDIITKYGKPINDEDGNETTNVALEPGTEGYVNAMKELSDIEDMTLEVFPMLLDMDDLTTISEKVPMAQLVNLMWMTKKYQCDRNRDDAPERFTRPAGDDKKD